MANTVSFKIKIEGSNELKSVTVDTKELGAAFSSVQAEVKNLKGEMVSFASKVQILEGAFNAIGQIQGILSGVSSAYTAQEAAETRLTQAMRNTMGATDAEIQSIKDLTAAQQRIGIVGADVQLSAAQELATYLEFSDSLKTIIPVMNDMIAQQLSLGASAESATQIATMLGKVMNGQTEALSRYGYKFDDAQKYILKYGDESERAAVLAEVVEQSVAGMNEAMARTPSGRMQQAANALGDIKGEIGQLVQGAMPFISTLAEIAKAGTGVLTLTDAFQALGVKQLFAKIHTMGLTAAERLQSTAAKVLGKSTMEAKTATGALKVEIIATEAAITMGISLAVAGLIELFSRLIGQAKGAAGVFVEVSEAEEAYKQAAASARMETASDIVELENLIKKKQSEGAKVAELNTKYGNILGTYSSAAEWYDVLIRKSSAYTRQLAMEAKQKSLTAQVDEKKDAFNSILDQMRQLRLDGKDKELNLWGKVVVTDAYKALASQAKAIQNEITTLTQDLAECASEAQKASNEIAGAGTAASSSWKNMSLADLKKAIQAQEDLLESIAGVSGKGAEARKQKAILAQMKARKTLLEKSYGLGSVKSEDKEKYNGDRIIENARTYLEAGNNVKYYQNEINKADQADTVHIQTLIAQRDEWKRTQEEIEKTYKALSLPVTMNSLEDIEAHLSYWQSVKPGAKTDAERSRIEAEIQRLNDLKTAFELASYTPLKDEEIKTFKQLDREIEYYTALVQNAAGADRTAAQQKLDARNKLKEVWQEELEMVSQPAPIGQLDTLKDLDDALAYYQARTQRQQGDELSGTYRIIEVLQHKQHLLEQLSSIPEMQREIADLDALSGRELKVELDLIGLEGMRSKLRDLKKLLNDSSLTEGQRKNVEELIGAYGRYADRIRRSNLSLSESWSTIRGLGDSVESLTEALKEDGLSWQKLGAIVDSSLGIYEAVKGVVQIIKALVGASEAHTAAKIAEAGAEGAEAAANAAATTTNVTASAAQQTALALEAQAWKALAAAKAYAAYAALPGGQLLAQAFVTQMDLVVAMQRIIPFANGGIVYGPTLGLFGEYAGASRNPEVVAPLDKLESLLGVGSAFHGKPVEFRVRGRDLVAVINHEFNIRNRG